jgi:hypothetical protein
MALSTWGKIPDDLDIDFAAMDTPTAAENADVVQKRTSAIVQAYQSDLLDQKTARMELNAMDEETGAFGSIPDELIEQGDGVLFSAQQKMQDPMAGLFADEGETTPPDRAEAPENGFNEGG